MLITKDESSSWLHYAAHSVTVVECSTLRLDGPTCGVFKFGNQYGTKSSVLEQAGPFPHTD
eukprot:365707-Chlamydomonas_euryale.AAC.29